MSSGTLAVPPGVTAAPSTREDASRLRGRDLQRNTIKAARLVSEVVRTSLGPRGLDKMLVDSVGNVTITNDGATMLKEMDVQHPGAKMLIEVAKATDNEVGDGTTSAVVLAGALLDKAEELLDLDVHPTVIVDGYTRASQKAIDSLRSISDQVRANDRVLLTRVARTSMQTKLTAHDAEVLADLAVGAVLKVAEERGGRYRVNVDDVEVEKKPGGSITDSSMTEGVILDRGVSHGGMPKRIDKARVALVNTSFEIEKTEIDAKHNIDDPEEVEAFRRVETELLKGMVEKATAAGANVIICQKGIADVAQHRMANAGVLAVKRVSEGDIARLAKATGARIVTDPQNLTADCLGSADLVEERRIEGDRWVFVEGCRDPKSVSVLLRGGSQRVVDEAERSMHDALMVTKDVLETPAVVAGGGAAEEEVASRVIEWAEGLSGRDQLAAQKFGESLETISLGLAENAGLDPIDARAELRTRHMEGKKWHGIDATDARVRDMYSKGVLEPLKVKEQYVKSATEAACMLLRIDDMIAVGKTHETAAGEADLGQRDSSR